MLWCLQETVFIVAKSQNLEDWFLYPAKGLIITIRSSALSIEIVYGNVKMYQAISISLAKSITMIIMSHELC